MGWWFKIPLWVRILAAMAVGVGFGFALRPDSGISLGLDPQATGDTLKLIGDAFVRLIRMLAVPLILVSVTAAVVSIGDLGKLGTSGAKVAAL